MSEPTRYRDSYGDLKVRWFLAIITSGVLGLIALVFLFAQIGTYYADRASCSNFAVNTSRVTSFRRQISVGPVPLSWECFTPTAGGKWVPTSALREFGQQP